MASARLATQDYHNSTGGINDGGLLNTGNPSVSKKVACDRCRGQKLRCVWDPRAPRCRRCERAKTVCAVLPPRPMGRPCARAQPKNSQHNPTLHHQQNQEYHCRAGKSQVEPALSVSQYSASVDIARGDMEMQDGLAEMIDGMHRQDSSSHHSTGDLAVDPLLGNGLSPHSFLMQLSQT